LCLKDNVEVRMIGIKRIVFACLIAALVLLLPGSGIFCAQDEKEKKSLDVVDMSLEELLNMEVVSAAKFSQKMSEAPGVISVITDQHIREYGWLSMNEMLAAQPGFFPSQDYDRRTVGSRGLFEGWNNNHLLLLVDGIPHNDNLYGTAYTWEITPLFLIQSLEIIRGPGSALYGSNATNGVINIKTVSVEDLKKRTIAQVRLGNYNSQIYDMVGGGETGMFAYVLGFNVFRTAGNEYESYDGSYRTDSSGDLARFRIRDTRSSEYFFGKITGRKGLDGLEMQVHYQSWSFQTGHGWLWMIPDFGEAMRESRFLASLSYKPKGNNEKISQEYVVRYQRHNIDWNMRLYPDGAFDNWYPAGTWEYLKTDGEDIFARAQVAVLLDKGLNVLGGIEGSIFMYNGDEEHFSNTDLNDAGGFIMDDGTPVPSYKGWFAPFPGNTMRAMGPWFEWVEKKPVKNIGIYAQLATGEWLGKKLKATLGMRYDYQSFNFDALDLPGKPEESKTFSQFSPRLGLVYVASESLSFKALAGRAFRAPSPTEMFGANTWTLGSNLRELDPELITTFEFAMDWKLNKNVNLRINGFHTKFENQIAYSVENNNLSTNIYTLTNAGVETELLFAFGNFNGFLNASVYKRLDEEIFDMYIAESKDELTWAPAQTLNFGLRCKKGKLGFSVQGHYQGKVKRRSSDFAEPLFVPLRPEEVKAWFSMNARVSVDVSRWLELGLCASNLFDSENYLIKNFSYPFDYRMMGSRIFSEIRIKL
jgi:outer membrane receptor protein involved in Fe transport